MSVLNNNLKIVLQCFSLKTNLNGKSFYLNNYLTISQLSADSDERALRVAFSFVMYDNYSYTVVPSNMFYFSIFNDN